MMRTDYFAGLLPASVTLVTHAQNDCVTPAQANATHKNSDLAGVSRTSRMSRTKNSRTEKIRELSADDDTTVRNWLSFIGETDAEMIALVLKQCQADTDALQYFLWRAEEASAPDSNGFFH